jgi:hypothetical protein
MKRNAEFEALWERASAAGMAAAVPVKPREMVIYEADLSGAPLAGGQAWREPEGACGFAWVVVRPGNCAFAKWAKENKGASKHYYGGMQVKWVGEFNQSVERKSAYAYAFADVLNEAGIAASADSRLD